MKHIISTALRYAFGRSKTPMFTVQYNRATEKWTPMFRTSVFQPWQNFGTQRYDFRMDALNFIYRCFPGAKVEKY